MSANVDTMQIRTPLDLGHAIRERRKQLGLDQSELAQRIGVSRQWVVEIERGKPRAEVGLLLRALRALELRLDASAPDEAVGARGSSQSRGSKAGVRAAAPDLDALIERARGQKP